MFITLGIYPRNKPNNPAKDLVFYYSQNLSKKHKFPSKSTFSRSTCQGWDKIFPTPVVSLLSDPENHCGAYTPMEREVLQFLITLSNNFTNIFPSYETIAKKVGCHRKTVERAIKKFREDGVIATNYRHMDTNLYKLAEVFYDFRFRYLLKNIFKAFAYLPIFLVPFVGKAFIGHSFAPMSHNIKKDIYKYNLLRNMRDIIGAQSPINVKANAKKEVLVMSEAQNPISMAIRGEVTQYLRLTRAGQVNLTAFTDEAIQYAIMKTKEFPAAQNRLAYFVSQCIEYSTDKHLPIDYQYSDTLKVMYHLSGDARLTFPLPKQDSEEYSKAMAAPKPILEKSYKKPVERMSVPNPHAPKSYRIVKQHREPLTDNQRHIGRSFLAMLGMSAP